MDLYDPKRRLQVLNQSSPSIRLSVQPSAPLQVSTPNSSSRPLSVGNADGSQMTSSAPRAPIPVPETQYKGYSMSNPKTKSIFGIPVGNILGSYGKTYSIKADQNVNFASPQDFLKNFDNTSDEFRQAYVSDLQKNAANDPTSAKTLQLLSQSGRFKGNIGDFLSGANDKLYGGISRGLLRGADLLLPGHNTFGLEQEAKRQEAQPQYTAAGKAGEKVGSVEKGVVDIGSLLLGGGDAEGITSNLAKGTKVEEVLNALSKGNTVERIGGKVLTRIPSFLAETGIQSAQQAGTGEKQNWKNNLLVALGTEGASQVFGPILSKGIFKLRGGEQGAADRLLNKLAKAGDETKVNGIVDKLFPEADNTTKKAVSNFIANSDDKQAISNVLDTMSGKSSEVPLPDWVKGNTTNGPVNPNGDIKMFDPSNPPQSAVPAGMHPPGTADPVQVMSEKVKKVKSADEFQSYYDNLTGEDKAVADSALNGKTPKEFYNQVTGRANTVLHLPEKGVHATLSPEEAAILADENKNIPFTANDRPHLTAGPNVLNSTKEVTQEELAAMSPNAKKALEDAQAQISKASTEAMPSGDLPPEDIAAIKQAGGIPPAEIQPQSGVSGPSPTGDLQPVNPAQASPEVDAAKQQIMDSLKDAQTAYTSAATTQSAERGARAAKGTSAFESAGGGEAGLHAKLGSLKGDLTKSNFTVQIPKENYDTLINDIERNAALKPYEKLNAQIALTKLTKDGPGPTASDITYLRNAFGNEFADSVDQAVKDATTGGEKARELVGQIVGAPKSIMASYDLSGTLRQGGVLTARFPKEAAGAFKEQLRYFGSTEAYKQGMAEIASRPSYETMLKSKLAVTGTEGLDKAEEQFVSNLAEKIPGFGRGVAASDRAYTGFLTKLRADVFDNITSRYADEGIQLSDKELHDISSFINTASGRGDLGKYLEQHSQTLSTALFSPRLWKSRLDLLNPVYYAKLSGPARKYALQSAASFAAEATTILGLASLAGAHVETDMRSSDFGKIKVGNTRYDILGGLQQNVVFAWREISGEKKNSETGDITDLTSGKFGAKDRLSTLTDMIQNKENPALAAGQRILQGHDRGGNPVNPLVELAKLVTPLPLSGMYEASQDTGSIPKGIALNLPDIFGVSAQTYGTVKSKDKGKLDTTGVPTFKGKVTPDMVTDSQGNAITDAKGQPIKVKFPEGATDLEKQAMIDDKRASALKDRYTRTLSSEDQSLMKLTDDQLKGYVKSGTIDQAKFDYIKNIQKTAESQSKDNNYDVPDGIKSPLATKTYQKYNSMDAKDQKYWLSDQNPPDEASKAITTELNKKLPKGLSPLKPSNAVAKLYADYEKDIYNHPEYTDIDLQNKNKSFQKSAYQLNYSQNVQDLYKEGSSGDAKSLIANKQISKKDLDAAIKMDNELYESGLTGTLKFSKKFRGEYGYGLPASYEAKSGVGPSSSKNAYLSSLLPSSSGTSSGAGKKPTFSKRSRALPSFKSVNLPKGSSAPKVTIKL